MQTSDSNGATRTGFLQRTIRCGHSDYADYELDLSELWEGAGDEKPRKLGGQKWAGAFRGRPKLASELIEVIRCTACRESPEALRCRRTCLRGFWRFLDAYESYSGDRIDQLCDIASSHGILWLEPPPEAGWVRPSNTLFKHIRYMVEQAREVNDLSRSFWWPSPEYDRVSRADVPTESQARELIHELKRLTRAIFQRWAHADDLAEKGRNLIELYERNGTNRQKKASAADCHATYRALIAAKGNPVPDVTAIRNALGLQPGENLPPGWPLNLTELTAGLYPFLEDIQTLIALFLARTGWNPATAFMLDISSDEWARRIGDADANLWLIQSYKVRAGGEWQDTICSGKPSTHPYQIVTRLIDRTAPLRAIAVNSPARVNVPALASRSPWIAASLLRQSVTVIDRPAGIGVLIKRVAIEHNATAPPHRIRIPVTFKPSDFRDIVAAFTFRDSRYSMLLVQWVLGHKHLRSARAYLRSKMWRNHSEGALKLFGTVLIDEIEVHRRVDPTVLRARIEGHEISEIQVQRLLKYRTAVGMGCADPCDPDPHIDPANPRNGSIVCVDGQRCPGCTRGVALWDAWRQLCKQVAKLEWLRTQVSGASWHESHYSDDLAVLIATLKQWPDEDVSGEIRRWRDRIQDGSYRPDKFAGSR